MKKLLLMIAMVAVGFTANAQDGKFNLGVNGGLPIGDASDVSSFMLGLEANYLFEMSDEFKLGPSVSYVNFFGKDRTYTAGGTTVTVNGSNASMLPIAAAARFNASEQFVLGADLGYGISLEEGGNGGFYYRPLIGYNVSDNIMLQAAYTGVSTDGISPSAISLGAVFGL